jgi:LemA protein
MLGYLLLAVIVGAVLFAIKTYNGLRAGSEGVKRANSDLQGELRKRATLANQLIDVCKGYGDHEKLTHVTVANQTASLADSASLARSTNTVIERVTAFAANFPDLKANNTYGKLMGQLEDIENLLQEKRESYNRAVEHYNTHRASFPTVLFSEQLGFPEAPYFKTDETGLDEIAHFKTDDGTMLREQMSRLGDAAGQAGRRLASQTSKAIEQVRERSGNGSALAAATELSETGPSGSADTDDWSVKPVGKSTRSAKDNSKPDPSAPAS